jgi:hypothetical protein
MTDVTIREIRDLRELDEPPPAARPEPDPNKEKAAREAALADALALIARLDAQGL